MNQQEDYGVCAMFYVKDPNKGLTLDNLRGRAKDIIEHIIQKGYVDIQLVHNPRDENQAFLMVPKDVSTKVSFFIGCKYRSAFKNRDEE